MERQKCSFLRQFQKRIFRNVYSYKVISWDPNLWPGPTGNENSSCTMVRARIKVTKGVLKLFSYICQGARQGLPGQAELQQSSAMLRMPIRSRLPQNGAGLRDLFFCFAFCNLCAWQFLKGLCVDDSEDFDTEYYVHGIVNGKMHFK